MEYILEVYFCQYDTRLIIIFFQKFKYLNKDTLAYSCTLNINYFWMIAFRSSTAFYLQINLTQVQINLCQIQINLSQIQII